MTQNFTVVEYEELAQEGGSLENDVVGLASLKWLIKGINMINTRYDFAVSKGVLRPKGIIFSGPPGVGKTLVGKYVAKELKYGYIYAPASSLQSPLPGIAARLVKALFEAAEDLGKCVLFIDEIDAIIKDRATGGSDGMGVLQQFLTLLDKTISDRDSHVLVIVATNHPEHLDKAFTRAGRFSRKIHFTLPGPDERKEFLKLLEGCPIDPAVFVEMTDGFSYAEMDELVQHIQFDMMVNGVSGDNASLYRAVRSVVYGSSSNKEQSSASTAKFLRPHMAGHTLGYMFAPDVFVIGSAEESAEIKCKPRLSTNRVYGRKEIVAQIMSILFAQIAEVKYARDTSSLSKHDQFELEALIDELLSMFGANQSGNLNKAKLRVALVSYLAKFANAIAANPIISNLLDSIYKFYGSSGIMTRNDLINLMKEHNITGKETHVWYKSIVRIIEENLKLKILTVNEALKSKEGAEGSSKGKSGEPEVGAAAPSASKSSASKSSPTKPEEGAAAPDKPEDVKGGLDRRL